MLCTVPRLRIGYSGEPHQFYFATTTYTVAHAQLVHVRKCNTPSHPLMTQKIFFSPVATET